MLISVDTSNIVEMIVMIEREREGGGEAKLTCVLHLFVGIGL